MLAQYVILGLLKERPMHGYEIKQRFERISGLFWKVSYGSLYPALRKLAKAGFIIQQSSSCKDSPGRKVFYLTEEGETALYKWLRKAHDIGDVDRNSTNEFMLRLIFFSFLPKEEAQKLLLKRQAMVQEKWEEMQGKLEEIESREEKGDYYKLAMLDYIIRMIRAEKSWLEDLLSGKDMPSFS